MRNALSILTKISLILLVANFTYITLSSAGDGIRMKQVRYIEGSDDKELTEIVMKNNKMMIRELEPNSNFKAVFDLNTGKLTQINMKTKEYSVATPEDYFKFIQQITQKFKEEFEKQFADYPEEQRKQIEDSMRKRGIAIPGEKPKPKQVKLEETNNTEKIADYKSKEFKIFVNDNLEEIIFTSNEVGFDKEIDLEKMSNYMTEMKKLSENFEGSNAITDNEIQIYKKVYESGFPMKTVDYSNPAGKTDKNEKPPKVIEVVVEVTKGGVSDEEIDTGNLKNNGFKEIQLADFLKASIPGQ